MSEQGSADERERHDLIAELDDLRAELTELRATPNRLRESMRQVHAQHDLGHQLGAWPRACALCQAAAALAEPSR